MQENLISFEFYFNTYNGGSVGCLNQENYRRYIIRAVRELERFCKLPKVNHPDFEAVKLCLCEVAEELFGVDKEGSVKSETIDGYSVTYGNRKEPSDRIRSIVLRRLGDTGLIYAGVE